MQPGNGLMGAEKSKLTTCERFIMVVHHWSNDGMVTYYRGSLVFVAPLNQPGRISCK